jgi:hypothetical protein
MTGYHLQISFLHDIIFLGDDAKLHMWSFFKLPLTSILFSPLTIFWSYCFFMETWYARESRVSWHIFIIV